MRWRYEVQGTNVPMPTPPLAVVPRQEYREHHPWSMEIWYIPYLTVYLWCVTCELRPVTGYRSPITSDHTYFLTYIHTPLRCIDQSHYLYLLLSPLRLRLLSYLPYLTLLTLTFPSSPKAIMTSEWIYLKSACTLTFTFTFTLSNGSCIYPKACLLDILGWYPLLRDLPHDHAAMYLHPFHPSDVWILHQHLPFIGPWRLKSMPG